MRSGPRYRDAVFPLILVVAGVIALLINTHVLSQQAVDNLAALWPLILVVIGVQLVLRVVLPSRTATIASLSFAAAVVVAGLIVAIAGPAILPSGTRTVESTATLGDAASASLELDFGGSTISIVSQDLGSRAYQAHIEYPSAQGAPRIQFNPASDALTIRSGSDQTLGFFVTGARSVNLTLSVHVPWSIVLGGGAGDVHLNLPQLRLTGLHVGGGASNIDATLGPAKGTETIDVSGGASDVTIHLPQGSQWRLQVSGGASSVTVNGTDVGNGDGSVSQSSGGFTDAADRFDVQVSGGASDVSLDTNGTGS